MDELVAAFDDAIGLERLVMVHLNDSRSERGSRADRHEHVGAGRIGGEGLARVLTHPDLGHVAYILETPGMDEGYDAVNLDRARDARRRRAARRRCRPRRSTCAARRAAAPRPRTTSRARRSTTRPATDARDAPA